GPGQFVYPVGIVQDDEENFYVCEYGEYQDRVQKFSVDGEFLLEFGGNGMSPGEFQRPSGMVWHNGNLYVADAINNRIQVFSDSGEFLEVLGSRVGVPALEYPYDLTLADDGSLFVVEYGAGRVTQLDLAGRVLGRYGTTGRGEAQFVTPWGIAAGHGGLLYVADTGNRRIVELRL
ncbi:MAG: hypothetical protein ACREIV_02435, partial [Planctomycetaceae bacterium]